MADPLTYFDLESEIHDAVNMCEIACDMQLDLEARVIRNQTVDQRAVARVTFAVNHAAQLMTAVKRKWHAVHDSQVAAKSAGKAVEL